MGLFLWLIYDLKFKHVASDYTNVTDSVKWYYQRFYMIDKKQARCGSVKMRLAKDVGGKKSEIIWLEIETKVKTPIA